MKSRCLKISYSKPGAGFFAWVLLPAMLGITSLMFIAELSDDSAMAWLFKGLALLGCLYFILNVNGFYSRLKGGDVPAIEFRPDRLTLSNSFGRYDLKPEEIRKVRMISVNYFSNLIVDLKPPYEFKNFLGLPLKRISIQMPLSGMSKKKAGQFILAWSKGELPIPEVDMPVDRVAPQTEEPALSKVMASPRPASAAAEPAPDYQPVVRKATGGFGRRVRR